MSDIAREIISIQQQLETNKATLNAHCREIASLILPRQMDFFTIPDQYNEGNKRTQSMMDSTPASALNKFAALYESITTPRSDLWHRIKLSDPKLDNNREIQIWLDQVNQLIFDKRYSSLSNFASQNHENNMSVGAFGTGVLFTSDAVTHINYKSTHMSENHLLENESGVIDTNYRKYYLTAKQATEKFGANTPEKIMVAAKMNPSEKFCFIHCVRPNLEIKRSRKDYSSMKFSSYHISIDCNCLISVGGYRTFPFHVNRYVTAPNETYGRGPAMIALPEIKMVNKLRTIDLRAKQMGIEPTLLVQDSKNLRELNITPSSIIYGGLDAMGRDTIKPLNQGNAPLLADNEISRCYEKINDIFMVNLFNILVETPTMTATEVLERAGEKGALLSPTAGRMQCEYLGPLIEREIDIYEANDLLPPKPEILKKLAAAGENAEYKIEFTSLLNSMQKATEENSARQWISGLVPLAQINPNIMDWVNMDQYAKMSHKAAAIPELLIRSDEEVAQMAAQKAEQQQIQQALAAAPDVAGSIKDIAQAQNYGL